MLFCPPVSLFFILFSLDAKLEKEVKKFPGPP